MLTSEAANKAAARAEHADDAMPGGLTAKQCVQRLKCLWPVQPNIGQEYNAVLLQQRKTHNQNPAMIEGAFLCMWLVHQSQQI